MSSDYREGYQVGLKDGKRLGLEEYEKELADSLKNAMPKPLMVVNDVPTLRDKFAIGAMQGFCANPEEGSCSEIEIAQWSYEMADAMLKERNKRG